MKNTLNILMDDFLDRSIPDLTNRESVMLYVKGKVTVVTGMRRVGKTWFCYQHIKHLMANNIDKNRILYINFEDDRLLQFTVENFRLLLNLFYSRDPSLKDLTCYFFFDEIQTIENWEIFIRRLIDTENAQIFLTGSSSRLMSSEIATSLRGRSITQKLFPFSFREFLKYRNIMLPEGRSSRTLAVLRKNMHDFLEIGGFPEVQDLSSDLRIEILQNYLDVVVLRDVVERHKVSNITALRHMIISILHAPGSCFSVNKFYNTCKSLGIKCTKDHLYQFLDYLCDAFLFYKVPLHTRSERFRIVNPPKLYTIDTGLLGAISFRNSSNRGAFLENLVCITLVRNGFTVEYWKSPDNYELDFITKSPLGELSLIQVCWTIEQGKTLQREIRGLNSAMTQFGKDKGLIITWDEMADVSENIQAIPVYDWLLSWK